MVTDSQLNLTQIKVALASVCFAVIGTVLAEGRVS
jgi:hypothetical protein